MSEYSWTRKAWDTLMAARQQDRLAHALLLSGAAGLGKRRFATRLVDTLLCTGSTSPGAACGQCKGCHLRGAGNHPDCMSIGPEDGKTSIGVDAIREISGFLNMTSFAGGYKIAVIDPAEGMTANAANSLLKSLEEPPGSSLLLLVTERPERLTATVRSRCQDVRFSAPNQETAIGWLRKHTASDAEQADWNYLLEFAAGAPLKAQALAEQGFPELRKELDQDLGSLVDGRADPIAVAARWNKRDPAVCLDWLIRQVQCLIKVNSGAVDDEAAVVHLQKPALPLNLTRLFAYLDQLQRARSLLGRSVNMQLAFEALLIPWCHQLELLPDLTG